MTAPRSEGTVTRRRLTVVLAVVAIAGIGLLGLRLVSTADPAPNGSDAVASGLGAPADIDTLKQKINHLEQQAVYLRLQLDERDQDLAAARSANRDLMAQLNTAARHP